MIASLILLFGVAAAIPLSCRFSDKITSKSLCLIPLGLAVYYTHLFLSGNGAPSIEILNWISHLGIHVELSLDGLSFFFAILILGIGTLTFYYADGYFHSHAPPSFYVLLNLFMASMLGLVLSNNVFIMFIFWELTSFTSYLLIGHYHKKQESRKAALQAFLVTGAGGLCLLAGIVILSDISGTGSFFEICQGKAALTHAPLFSVSMILMLLGALTKSAQFPFHFWLPGAMAAPAPVSAFLHSATMVKAGIYLMARIHPLFGDQIMWTLIVSSAGCATMLVGAWLAFQQTYLKKYLAYTTVSALGTVTLMLGLGNDMAVLAAVTFLAAHALYKSALFMVAGAIHHRTGETDVSKLSGLASQMPFTAVAGTLAAASMAGIPPFIGFIGKELLYEGTLSAAYGSTLFTTAVFVSNALIAATACIIGYQLFWAKTPRSGDLTVHKGAVSLFSAPAVPAVLGLVFGLLPGLVISVFPGPAIMAVKPAGVEPELSLWHGWTTPLMLDMGALFCGFLLFRYRRVLQTGCPKWLNGETVFFFILNATLGFGKWQTKILQNGHLRYYIKIIVGTATLLSGYVILSRDLLSMVSFRITGTEFYDFGLALLILSAVIVTILTRSRLTAVASLGVIGFSVALIFVVFSAPDLAMTQFAIETLMVLLLVLVLYHLPIFSSFTNVKTRIRDGVIAVSAGCLMAFLTRMASQYQYSPSISEYYRQNSLAAHGKNLVNLILVDFRGFDTLGEMTVLAVAALGVVALLKFHKKPDEKDMNA